MTLIRNENATFYGLFLTVAITLGVYAVNMLMVGSH